MSPVAGVAAPLRVEVKGAMLRANRTFGAMLVEHGLVSLDELSEAGEMLAECLVGPIPWRNSYLKFFVEVRKKLKEDQLLHLALDEHPEIGLVNPSSYEIPDDLRKSLDLEVCWATLSMPYDRDDGVIYIASAFNLSAGAKSQWAKHFPGLIIWSACTTADLDAALDALANERKGGS